MTHLRNRPKSEAPQALTLTIADYYRHLLTTGETKNPTFEDYLTAARRQANAT